MSLRQILNEDPQKILNEVDPYPIRPEDLHEISSAKLRKAFHDADAALAAVQIIENCQSRRCWGRFRAIRSFHFDEARRIQGLKILVETGSIAKDKFGWYYLTQGFIDLCCTSLSDC